MTETPSYTAPTTFGGFGRLGGKEKKWTNLYFQMVKSLK